MLQDKATLLLLPYVFFWGHLVLNCCTGSWGSTDSLLNCQEECELYPSFALVCILVACMSRFFSTSPCVCVRMEQPLLRLLRRSPPDTQARRQPGHANSDGVPSHNRAAKPGTSQEEVWYDESGMNLALSPCWTDSGQLPHPQPNFKPFKSTLGANPFPLQAFILLAAKTGF